jgi:maleate isomerase
MSMRIGLIVPSSNTVMEPDFHRHFTQPNIVSTTRIFLERVTREAEAKMLDEDLPVATQLIKTTAPDIVVFGCTSAGSLDGLIHDDGIGKMIAVQTGAKAITALRAAMQQLEAIRPQKIAVLTPYIEDLTASIARCISEGGYSIVKAAGMGITENLEIGSVTPAQITEFVESRMKGIAADCVFLSCTNWRAIEAIEPLQRKLGIPVLTSNQCAIDETRKSTTRSNGSKPKA